MKRIRTFLVKIRDRILNYQKNPRLNTLYFTVRYKYRDFKTLFYSKKLRHVIEIINIMNLKLHHRVPSSDLSTIHYYLIENKVMPQMVKYLDLNQEGMIIDIGAHIGIFSILASLNYKNKILSFEPDKSSFDLLKSNIENNQINTIDFYNNAIGLSGNQKFYQSSSGELGNNFYKKNLFNYYMVKSYSLQEMFINFNIKKVNLLRINAEGSEFDIITKDYSSYLDFIHNISVDYHLDYNKKGRLDSLIEILYSRGFYVITKKESKYRGVIYASRSKMT